MKKSTWLLSGVIAAILGVAVLYAQEPQISQRGIVIIRGNLDLGGGAGNRVCYEGATVDANETCLAVTDPTADRTITLPDETGTLMTNTGAITSSSATAGIGYATGAGCAVTQITSRTTGVTCAGTSGAITTDTTSLAAEATAKFTVTNTSVAVGDVIVVSQRSGSNGGGTIVHVTTVAAGSFQIAVYNGNVAAGTAETGAIIINFAVIKAVSA